MKKAVGYTRSTKPNKKDIKKQKKKIKEYCKKEKIVLEKIFEDNGKPETLIDRPGLQAMLAKCSEKGVDCLIVHGTSRLSRDIKDYITIKAMLRKYDVKVVVITGKHPSGNDPYFLFIDEILASVNALQPRVIKNRDIDKEGCLNEKGSVNQ